MAWEPLGWEPAFFAEIAEFPSAVLAERWPGVPNLGDFTKIGKKSYAGAIDLLVGGTPCQDFSLAGPRKGMGGARGQLTLEFCKLVDRLSPRWVLWENVPGVLSSNGGRDFGAFLGALGKLGYGFAYRVLDVQYVRVEPGFPRGVPQRRQRVFVVGHSGGEWRRAAAVLFERDSLRWDNPPRREAGTGVARTLSASLGGPSGKEQALTFIGADGPLNPLCAATGQSGAEILDDLAPTLNCDHDAPIMIQNALREGNQHGLGISTDGVSYTLDLGSSHALCFTANDNARDLTFDKAPTLRTGGKDGGVITAATFFRDIIRKLTPLECERLMGFTDHYTRIPWRGKPAEKCPDGPRYKALGNSQGVNVMRWLATRIALVASITN